jgi:hypothetical protein
MAFRTKFNGSEQPSAEEQLTSHGSENVFFARTEIDQLHRYLFFPLPDVL